MAPTTAAPTAPAGSVTSTPAEPSPAGPSPATATTAPERSLRVRWAAIGAAVAVALGGGGLFTAQASIGSGDRSVFVPITPCRLFDTRPAPDNVGSRNTALGPGDTFVAQVHGTNGNCTIPSDAVAVAMNVVVIDPTASSFLTVFPSDATRPLSSNLNWVARQAPTPNAVTADLSASGAVSFYNLAGQVQVAADIVGYYADHQHDDRYYTKAQTEAIVDTRPGWTSRLTDEQIAFGRWWQDPAKPMTVPAGTSPLGLLFDGTNVWVSNLGSSNVTKIDADTGNVVGTYATGNTPGGMAFDGTYLWIVSGAANTITKLVAATGQPAPGSPLTVASDPSGIVFDGDSIWVADFTGNQLVDIDPATNAVTNVPLTAGPNSLAFDGTHVWATLTLADQVVKVAAATRTVGTPFSIPGGPLQLAYDGGNMWITSGSGDAVRRVAPDGTVLQTVTVLGNPSYLAYDGSYVWVTATGTEEVVRVHAASGAVDTTTTTSSNPRDLVFDGRNMWLARAGGVDRMVP